MFIRESWGIDRVCRIGSRIAVAHEIITYLEAPVFNEGMHTNKWSQIIIHISGDVNYASAYEVYSADSLDIFSVDTDEAYCIDWGRKKPYERFAIYFDNDLLEDIFPDSADYRAVLGFLNHKEVPNLLKLSDSYKDELTALLNKIDPMLGSNDSDANISVFACLMSIFDLIHRVVATSKQRINFTTNNIVAKTLQYLDVHYKDVASINDVAEALHVSPEYLSKKFKADMDISLKNYLLDKKLQYSRHLLKLGYNVTEAANAAGFAGSSYFIQLYKGKYGVTPGKE